VPQGFRTFAAVFCFPHSGKKRIFAAMNKSPIIGVTPLWDAECKSVWMLPDYLDGIIEAAQMTNRRFVWAVQWHPEYMFKTDSDSSAIFSWFVEHCI
jgi:hypothetical protein